MTHPLLEDEREGLDVEASYAECARVARREARNFYFAFLPLRKERRRALYAVYSFARLADDLADAEQEPLEGRLEALGRLEGRLEAAVAGRPRGAVFTALADAVEQFRIPVRALEDLMTGVRRDQRIRRFETYEELCVYCYHVAGTVGLICAAVFDARGPEAEEYAEAQGLGMQLVNIMRDVQEDLLMDRIYLPKDLREQYGVTEEGLRSGRPGPGWEPMMAELAGRAREALHTGGLMLPLAARDARICPALLRELYEAILDNIEEADFDVFSRDPDLSLSRKVSLMLSAWWRYRVLP
ncbi:MAG: phytoene/squalene synthase family protein [bacterium]